MKINNNIRVDFHYNHMNKKQTIYYACYHNKKYLGVFSVVNIPAEMQKLFPTDKVIVQAYGRKSTAVRGRNGRYLVTKIGNYLNESKYIKNKHDALKSAINDVPFFDKISVTDMETGEILYWVDRKVSE